MSIDNSPLPVSFHGATLFLVERNGEPYTQLRPIVEGMGLDWNGQRAKLHSNSARWTVEEISTVAQDGKQRKTLCMPVRKLPAFLAGIHPNKVRPELRARIRQYQEECDDVLWQHWSGQRGKGQAPGWPALLPEPPDPITKEVRSAIHRRAHALGLRHYERLCADLERAVRRHAERCPEERDLAGFASRVAETPDNPLVVVPRADLWSVCNLVATARVLVEGSIEAVERLEEGSGQRWYNRV